MRLGRTTRLCRSSPERVQTKSRKMSASRRGRGKVMPRRALVAPSGVSLNSPLAGTPGALRPAPFGRRCPPCRGRGEVDGGVRSSEHSALCGVFGSLSEIGMKTFRALQRVLLSVSFAFGKKFSTLLKTPNRVASKLVNNFTEHKTAIHICSQCSHNLQMQLESTPALHRILHSLFPCISHVIVSKP